ncbi:radical SAM protein [Alphaproteobacteria bacterium]|nr:radical SAM protein [Alphaproteobacteria bacterium]
MLLRGNTLEHDLKLIDIEPVLGCNLRCRMCHVSFMDPKLTYLDVESINWRFVKDKVVSVGAAFEPLIHPDINQLINKMNENNAEIYLVTNGHNLNRKEIPALFDSKINTITFSFDGISQETYETVRRGGNFHRTLDNIKNFVSAHNGQAKFAINFTVMKENLHEVKDAPEFWSDIGIDLVRFISMVVREDDDYLHKNTLWDVRDTYFAALEEARTNVLSKNLPISISSPYFETTYKNGTGIINNVRNYNYESYHSTFEYSADSVLSSGCASPWRSVRINWDGDVFLCHWQKIGNLIETDFDTIWDGEIAQNLRDEITKTEALCEQCDYFNLCIRSHHLDLNKIANYYSGDFKDRFSEKWISLLAGFHKSALAKSLLENT